MIVIKILDLENDSGSEQENLISQFLTENGFIHKVEVAPGDEEEFEEEILRFEDNDHLEVPYEDDDLY